MAFNWQEFNTVWRHASDFSLEQKAIDNIVRHRKEFGDELFFDRIWKSIGLTQPSKKSYPPRSNQDLRSLWTKIVQSPAPDEQKLALIYYILLDSRQTLKTSPADTFIRKTHLPQKYELLILGLWELDHAQFSRALEHLADPTLTLPFADQILVALLKHPKSDPSLATAFYICVSPPLEDPKALDAYSDLLSSKSPIQAVYLARRQDQTNHKRLLDKLVVKILQEKTPNRRAEQATLLVGMALTKQEEEWLEQCLLSGPASKLPGASDTVLVRRIATGKLSAEDGEAIGRLKGEKIDGVNWENVRQSIQGAVPT
ncbi:hypothetical protein B0A52_00736 [Exophiala mesophila]|uniref:ELYS-like domain-containing protein n=1 Tax=Exophiala mesophila TaxID=212818 RepID=A0A438NI28_EXOME|nr:hypothetical protein B0A52_00736 [Exophiala mesophila]